MAFGVDPEDRIPGPSPRAPSRWPRHFGTSVRIGVVLVVLGAAAASGWPYIKEHFLTPSAPSGPLPVIGPGDEPIKEAPKQPGGMQVPDQDKVILNGPTAQPKVEQILPPPPAPLPSPTPAAPPAVVQTLPPQLPAPPSPPVAAAVPPPPVAPSTPSATASPPAPQAAPVTSPPPPPPPPPRPASVAATNSPAASTAPVSGEQVPTTLAGHGWFIQLGAVSSTAAAQSEWTRLKRAQADLLASLSANAVRVERGGGVIYRIEAGPLADGDAASHLCRSLQQRHVACIVLRP